jgi:MFS family permease
METKFLFAIVFLNQLFLMSFYFPKKIANRIQHVYSTYPPSKFPKLYPMPIEYYQDKQRNFRIINWFILIAGLFLLSYMFIYFPQDSHRERWDQALIGLFFMVQFSPVILLEIASFNLYKLMRKLDERTAKKAEFQPRRLFDFISPLLMGTTVLVYAAFVGFIFYFQRYDYPWFGGIMNIVIISGTNLLFIGMAVWHMFGKKLDPYQSFEDRRRQISFVIRQMAIVSIAMTIYAAFTIVAHTFEFRHFGSTFMSIYFQIIAVVGLRALQIDNINFDVYKED